jgi:hypothetical protein
MDKTRRARRGRRGVEVVGVERGSTTGLGRALAVNSKLSWDFRLPQRVLTGRKRWPFAPFLNS